MSKTGTHHDPARHQRAADLIKQGKPVGRVSKETDYAKATLRKIRAEVEAQYAKQGKELRCECGRKYSHAGLCDYAILCVDHTKPEKYNLAVEMLLEGSTQIQVQRKTGLEDQTLHKILKEIKQIWGDEVKCQCGRGLNHRGPCIGVKRGPYECSAQRAKLKAGGTPDYPGEQEDPDGL